MLVLLVLFETFKKGSIGLVTNTMGGGGVDQLSAKGVGGVGEGGGIGGVGVGWEEGEEFRFVRVQAYAEERVYGGGSLGEEGEEGGMGGGHGSIS